MKQIFNILLVLLSNHFVFSQEKVINNDSINIEKIWIENIDSLNPINGIEKGVVVYQTINDTLDGVFKVYDENETLRLKANIYYGIKEGVAYIYTYKGELEEVRLYRDDIAISRIFIDHRGRIYRIASYDFKELKNGEEVTFFKNGNVWIKRIWKHGKLEKYTYFYRNGNIKKKYYHDKDEKLIRIENYKRNGKIREVIE